MKAIACALLSLALLAPVAGAQAPALELHALRFLLHEGALEGETLAFYQAALDDALEDARLILQGSQGPSDATCCTELVPTAALSLYGDPEDGGDLVDFDADLPALRAIAGDTPTIFLVSGLTTCGGAPAPLAIGCAETPACAAPAGTVAVVTLEALALDLLGAAIAHERGHNSCLGHTTGDLCNLMNATLGGSCLSGAECGAFRAAATAQAGSCACQVEPFSPALDGLTCEEASLTGVCSGGVCGAVTSEASARLVMSLDPGSSFDPAFVPTYDRFAAASGLTGGWEAPSPFASGIAPSGLAYAPERGVLYGVQDAGLDGTLLEIDPQSGAVERQTALVDLPGLISLAFDPGVAGAADDRLLAVERRAQTNAPIQQLEVLVAIDPDDGTHEALCSLVSNSQDTRFGFFPGLTYDTGAGRLVGAGGGGVFEIDPVDCSRTEILAPTGPNNGDIIRIPAALAYSAAADRVFLLGTQSGPRTLFTVIDQAVVPSAVTTALGLTGLTPGSLAAVPVPEPGAVPLGLIALCTIWMVRGARCG